MNLERFWYSVFNHDAKVRTFVRAAFGLAKNKHVLMLQADWGLGLGIIINGKLYSGNRVIPVNLSLADC
ncbi:MAG: hypothetical protein R2757_13545 [Draconibacterium sp.]